MELDKRFTACRLCLCSSESLIDIFGHHHGYIPAEIIIELLRFEVAKGDMFPQCVCGECLGKLTDFKKFKEICCIFKASLDRAYDAKFTKVPEKNLFLVGQSPVPCKIQKVRAVEEVGIRGPGVISHELDALNTDEGEVIVPDDLSRIPFFPAKAEINSEFEGNNQKNILVPIDLDQALCEDKSEGGALICPDISGVETIDQVKTESEADEKDPEAVDSGKGKIQEMPSRSACVAEESGCQLSEGTEEKRSSRLRVPQIVQVDGGIENDKIQETPSRSVYVAEKSGCVAVNFSCHPSDGSEEPQGGLPRVAEAEQVDGGNKSDNIRETPSRSARVAEKSGCQPSDGTEELRRTLPRDVDGVKGNEEVQSLSKSPSVAEKSRSKNGENVKMSGKVNQRIIVIVGKRGNTSVHRPSKILSLTKESRSKNAEDTENAGKMVQKFFVGAVGKRGDTVQSLPRKLFYQPKNVPSLLKSLVPAEKSLTKNSEDMVDPEKKEQRVVEAEGIIGRTDVQNVPKSPLVAEKDRSENSGDTLGTIKMDQRVVEAEGIIGRTDIQNVPNSPRVCEKDRSENSGDKEDTQKMDQRVVEAEGIIGRTDVQNVPKSPLVAEKDRSENSGDTQGTIKMGRKDVNNMQGESGKIVDRSLLFDGSPSEAEESNCESSTEESSTRVTRSMVAPPKQKKQEEPSSADSDDDVVDAMDDFSLEDSESDFKPEGMEDGSDGSDEEFVPKPPKRSKESSGHESPDCDCDACTGNLRKCHTSRPTSSFVNMDHDYATKPVNASGKSQHVVGIVRRFDDSKSKDVSEDEDTTDCSSDLDSEDTDEEERGGGDNIPVTINREKGVYDCSLCSKRYLQWRTFRCHMDQHKFGNRFKCNVCGKGFHRKTYLKSHMDVHQTERNFHCDVCGKAYKTSQLLNRHKIIHGEKNCVCELCGKKFLTVAKLNRHLGNHNKEKIYPCEECGKKFSTKIYVYKHVQTVHLKKWKNKHSCEVCGGAFVSPSALKNHRMVHSGERPFKCPVCDKACRTKTMLEIHVNTHTKEKSYKCDVCDAVLSNQASLLRHKERHTGGMKYKCDNCGKQYTQSHNLKNHLKKCHTDSG